MFFVKTLWSISVDCENMKNFAIAIGMNSVDPSIVHGIGIDCCNITLTRNTVRCDNDRITTIFWPSRGLSGTINGSAIPGMIDTIRIYNNSITGVLPQVLPSSITIFNANTNKLSGTIPNYSNGLLLVNLDLGFNDLSGKIPQLPPSLNMLYLADNLLDFQGQILPTFIVALKLGVADNFRNTLSIPNLILTDRPAVLNLANIRVGSLKITNLSGLGECDLRNTTLPFNPIWTMCLQDLVTTSITSTIKTFMSFSAHSTTPALALDATTAQSTTTSSLKDVVSTSLIDIPTTDFTKSVASYLNSNSLVVSSITSSYSISTPPLSVDLSKMSSIYSTTTSTKRYATRMSRVVNSSELLILTNAISDTYDQYDKYESTKVESTSTIHLCSNSCRRRPK